MTRRTWSPDETDVLIVALLREASGPHGVVVVRAELAELLTISVYTLGRRLRRLCQLGYLRQERTTGAQGHSRYVVVKSASVEDEHDLGGEPGRFSFDAKSAAEAVEGYRNGMTVRDLMEKFGASYGSVLGVLQRAGVQLRAPGGRVRRE